MKTVKLYYSKRLAELKQMFGRSPSYFRGQEFTERISGDDRPSPYVDDHVLVAEVQEDQTSYRDWDYGLPSKAERMLRMPMELEEKTQPNPANFVHEHAIDWAKFGVSGPGDCNHSTLDCPTCGGLLLVVDGYVVNFHPWLNAENPDWPADGKGTAHLEV